MWDRPSLTIIKHRHMVMVRFVVSGCVSLPHLMSWKHSPVPKYWEMLADGCCRSWGIPLHNWTSVLIKRACGNEFHFFSLLYKKQLSSYCSRRYCRIRDWAPINVQTCKKSKKLFLIIVLHFVFLLFAKMSHIMRSWKK